jgi:hypothetical protein
MISGEFGAGSGKARIGANGGNGLVWGHHILLTRGASA